MAERGLTLNAAPAPLVASEIDLRDLDSFMLNVERLLASELWALSSGEVFKAAVGLWCRAWKQVPAASLPNDDRVLASFAGLSVGRFRKLKGEVMRGFVLCSDGRYYHRVLASDAVRAWKQKQTYQAKREADRKRLEEWRKKRGKEPSQNGDETHFKAEIQDTDDTGQGRYGKDNSFERIEFKNSDSSKNGLDEQPTNPFPSERAIEQARELAPRYDIRYIENRFIEFNRGKALKNVDAAFLGFVKKHKEANPI